MPKCAKNVKPYRWAGVVVGITLAATVAAVGLPGGNEQAGYQFASVRDEPVDPDRNFLDVRAGEARRMTITALAAEIADGPGHRRGATDADIATVESAFGKRFPQQIRELYRGADGLPELGLAPLAKIVPIDNVTLRHLRNDGKHMWTEDADGSPGNDDIRIHAKAMQHFAVVGISVVTCLAGVGRLDPDGTETLLVDLNDKRLVPGHPLLKYHVCKNSRFVSALDLHGLLARQWTVRKVDRDEVAFGRMALVRARLALAGEGIPELIARIREIEPAHVMVSDAPPFNGPATPSALDAAGRRMGSALPADYRSFLSVQNGLQLLALQPVERFSPAGQTRPLPPALAFLSASPFRNFRAPYAGPLQRKRLKIASKELNNCAFAGEALLWCPQLATQGAAFLDLSASLWPPRNDHGNPTRNVRWLASDTAYATFSDWLRDRLASIIHSQYRSPTGVDDSLSGPASNEEPDDWDSPLHGASPSFSEPDNRRVIAAIWALFTQATPIVRKQVENGLGLHVAPPGNTASALPGDGSQLFVGDGPVTRAILSNREYQTLHIVVDQRVCIAANAVMAQTGVAFDQAVMPLTDGAGFSSYPEFHSRSAGSFSNLELRSGCPSHIEIVKFFHAPR